MEQKSLIEFISDYANRWSQQFNGGDVQIAPILPCFEEFSLINSAESTSYDSISQSTEDIIKVASQDFENTSNTPQDKIIELTADVEEWGKWTLTDGINMDRNKVYEVNQPDDLFIPALADSFGIKVGVDFNSPVTLINKRKAMVKHPFMIKPQSRVTATLQIKRRRIIRPFSLKWDVSGYIGLITSQVVNGQVMSLHNIIRILQRYYSPFMQIEEEKVIAKNTGFMEALYGVEQSILIQEECSGLIEEHVIYKPRTGTSINGVSF